MSVQILVNPYPYGVTSEQNVYRVRGSIALAGSATAAGEPLNWNALATGNGYNEILNGAQGRNTALVTAFTAGTAGSPPIAIITATAANNFFPTQNVTFVGNTSVLGLLLNGITVQVLTASPTKFTFASDLVGDGSNEVGLAVAAQTYPVLPVPGSGTITVPVTAVSASGGIITVTATNYFTVGASVSLNITTGTLGPKLTGQYTVLSSTGSAFTFASAATGSTGVGYAFGNNPPQPLAVQFYSASASGYVYQYDEVTASLFAMECSAGSPPVLVAIPAAAYPAGVLADVIKYEAVFGR